MMLLFDVDGTLVRCGVPGRRALEKAFVQVLGVERALESVRLDGSTDWKIIEDAVRASLGREPAGGGEVGARAAGYLELLDAELALARETYQVLPGASQLAAAAQAESRFVLGLATGNVE